ncbi:hypothetical protein [Segatella copri]|nr:hypothetical protein [Segatella copri]
MIVNRDKHPPLLRIDDSFMKYVITGDIIKKYQNDDGRECKLNCVKLQ